MLVSELEKNAESNISRNKIPNRKSIGISFKKSF